MGPTVFYLFIKVSLDNIIWKLKTSKTSFLKSMFKHPKMRNMIQTLKKKYILPNALFFLGSTVFSV